MRLTRDDLLLVIEGKGADKKSRLDMVFDASKYDDIPDIKVIGFGGVVLLERVSPDVGLEK